MSGGIFVLNVFHIDIIRGQPSTRRFKLNKFKHIIDKDGVERYFKDGKHHRVDGPAAKYPNGGEFWFLNGEYHRVDGPAIIYPDGTEKWYLNGERHRVDGPAAKYADGTEIWYLNGELHRENGPAAKYPDGTEKYYLNDVEFSKAKFYLIQINKKCNTITLNGEEFYLVPVK